MSKITIGIIIIIIITNLQPLLILILILLKVVELEQEIILAPVSFLSSISQFGQTTTA